MKKDVVMFSVFAALFALAFYGGYYYKQLEIVTSAKEVLNPKKTCYEVEDIEIIIFGEKQL